MIRNHLSWYESTLAVVKHRETTRNPSQDSCLGHFQLISPLDFEFHQNLFVGRPVFFSEGVRIFRRRDYLGNEQIYGQRFLFGRQVIFCVSKPPFLHHRACFCRNQNNALEAIENLDHVLIFNLKQKS